MATFSPTTETHIANMALSRLGEKEISNIDTDTTRAAEACERHFGQCRDEVLTEHFWNFAQRRVILRNVDDGEGGGFNSISDPEAPSDPGAINQLLNSAFDLGISSWDDSSQGTGTVSWDANRQAAKLVGGDNTSNNQAAMSQTTLSTLPRSSTVQYALRFEVSGQDPERDLVTVSIGFLSVTPVYLLYGDYGHGQHVINFTQDSYTTANIIPIFAVTQTTPVYIDNVSLVRTGVVNTFEWANAFWLPGDLFRLVHVYPRDTDYQIEGQYLLCDDSSVSIYYTARLIDPSKWTPDFKELVSLKLAHRIGRDLRGQSDLLAEIANEYAMKLADAMYRDAQAQAPREMGGLTHLYAHWGADEPFRRIENS